MVAGMSVNNKKNISLQKFRNSIISHQENTTDTIIDYLAKLTINDIPFEIIIILKSLKDSILKIKDRQLNIYVLVGSIFFLRFICPALSNKKELVIAKELQSIANQTNGENKKITDFLMMITESPYPTLVIKESVIISALNIYHEIIEYKKYHDTEIFKSLISKLGTSYKYNITDETDVPMYPLIQNIKEYIESYTNKTKKQN